MPIVTDSEVEKALHYLNDSVIKIGVAKGEVVRTEHMLKHIKAVTMAFSGEHAISGQERDALASDDYKAAILAHAEATVTYETLRAERENADKCISVWQSEQSNMRAMRI